MPKPPSESTQVLPDPENDRRQRRQFSVPEKQRILEEADACTERGQLGELLRREGIYSSHLANWRARREAEGAAGLAGRKPGRKSTRDHRDDELERQRRKIEKLEKDLRISRALIELQGKASEILGIALPRIEDAESATVSSPERETPKSR